MSEPARLTGTLLARKGQACPSAPLACPTVETGQALPAPHGLSPPRASMALVGGAPERRSGRARQTGGASGSGGRDQRVALTLRLDRGRHRRLRIFAARYERTSQEVILEALDAYLAARGGDCACLRGAPQGCVRS